MTPWVIPYPPTLLHLLPPAPPGSSNLELTPSSPEFTQSRRRQAYFRSMREKAMESKGPGTGKRKKTGEAPGSMDKSQKEMVVNWCKSEVTHERLTEMERTGLLPGNIVWRAPRADRWALSYQQTMKQNTRLYSMACGWQKHSGVLD